MTGPTVRLADIATMRNGLNFLRSDSGTSVAMIGVSDFVNRERIDGNTPLAHVQIKTRPHTEDLLLPGDLVFVRSNGSPSLVGRCIVFDGPADSVAHSGFTIRARVDVAKADPAFVSTVMRSTGFRDYLRQLGGGSSITNLSQSALAGFEFTLPPLVKQRKISEVLRTWDDAIDLQLAHQRTVQSRFAGVASLLLADRSDWSKNRLRDLSTPVARKGDGSDHPIMTISSRSGFVAQADKYQRDMAGASVANYTLVFRGEFAYNKGNSLSYPQGCIFRFTRDSGLVPNVYFAFRLNELLDANFYAHFFATGMLNRQLAQRISSSVRGNGLLNITAREFFDVEIPVPPVEEQKRISRALDAMRDEIALLDRKVELLREQKRGLAQKLLSGEIRVEAGESDD